MTKIANSISWGIFSVVGFLVVPWVIWGAILLGGWALLILAPAVVLYWILTYELYSRNSDGAGWRYLRPKYKFLRDEEHVAKHTEVRDVPSNSEDKATVPNQTKARYDHKHRHPLGAGTTFEPQ